MDLLFLIFQQNHNLIDKHPIQIFIDLLKTEHIDFLNNQEKDFLNH